MSVEAQLQAQFAPFAEEIDRLVRGVQQGDSVPELIENNDFARIYLLADGRHIGKVAFTDEVNEIYASEYMDRKVPALIKGLGQASLEQIVAYNSAEPSVIITSAVMGEPIEDYPFGQMNLSLQTYEQLFNIFRTMDRLGLGADGDDYTSKLLLGQDLTLVGYGLDQGDFMSRVLGFVRNISWSYPRGDQLPNDVMRYYAACDKLLGKESGLQVIDYLLRRGYALPPVDYDIE